MSFQPCKLSPKQYLLIQFLYSLIVVKTSPRIKSKSIHRCDLQNKVMSYNVGSNQGLLKWRPVPGIRVILGITSITHVPLIIIQIRPMFAVWACSLMVTLLRVSYSDRAGGTSRASEQVFGFLFGVPWGYPLQRNIRFGKRIGWKHCPERHTKITATVIILEVRWKKLLSIVQRVPCYGREPDGIMKEKKTQNTF